MVANLPWSVQLDKVAELSRLAAPGGFRDTQEEELCVSYQAAGWRLTQRLTRDAWAPEIPPEKSFTWVAWLLERPRGDDL
jgi:hypothetical protein